MKEDAREGKKVDGGGAGDGAIRVDVVLCLCDPFWATWIWCWVRHGCIIWCEMRIVDAPGVRVLCSDKAPKRVQRG